jgi:predicted metal-dependent phosphoesterase TrpH
MYLDLHLHTTAFSPCSTMTPDELMKAAKEAGLDGVCITEHNHIWKAEDAAALSREYGLAVLRGVEVTTIGGDVLVYGVDEDFYEGIWTPAKLKAKVDEAGGIAIAAHPFRGFLVFGFGELQLDMQEAIDNPVFHEVHGLEVCNSMVTDQENDFARQVAEELGLLTVGGSDAHKPEAVGTCVTCFHDVLADERDLVEALRNRRYTLERRK